MKTLTTWEQWNIETWLDDLVEHGAISRADADAHLAKLAAEARVAGVDYGLSGDPRITADD